MKKSNFTFNASIVSVMYWLLDSSLHRFIYGEDKFEFIPTEIDELWMRITIVLLLIGFGIYADRQTKAIFKKEEEKRLIFNATIYSTHHILNNLLNQMIFFKMKAEESNDFDRKTIELFEQTINEGAELVAKLGSVSQLTEEEIKKSVYPPGTEK